MKILYLAMMIIFIWQERIKYNSVKGKMVSLFKIFSIFLLLSTNAMAENSITNWIVYYSDKENSQKFREYDLIVLDADYHPDIPPLKTHGKTVLGYISLGEVEHQRYFFNDVKKQNILFHENKYWPGSYFVDVRDKRWAKKVLEEIIPEILLKKFDGLFLDTLDNLGHLERQNPEKYKGMVQAGINLVKAIRLNYPNIKIMMNRGYELLPHLAQTIDYELGESIYTDYNFETKTYQKVETDLYKNQVRILKKAQRKNPNLKIFTLDYWDPEDKETIKQIYSIERENGFLPYVATIELNEIVREPK